MESKAQDDDLVMTLVELALAQPPDERRAYIETACGRDTELLDTVWNFVQSEQRMNGFLLKPLYTPISSAEHPFEPDELLEGRFRIVREVAQGGMGIVYEAEDERLNRRIALKCAKAGFRKRLPPEVRLATEISHPNVCKIFEIHTAEGPGGEIDFLTMEFLDGETLAARLVRGRLADVEARAIARQLCAGLAEAHRKRVIHGDLKSSNVILTREAEGAIRAVITDFGLARQPEAAQPGVLSGSAAGTPDYMAPELWKGGKPTVASDIYALGVILYELVSGRKPFSADQTGPTPSWEESLVKKPPPVDPKWDRTLARCLDSDPARRFASADDIGDGLRPSQTRRWFAVAASALILAVFTGVVTYQRATEPKESVRLAVLPFQSDVDLKPLTEGLILDTSERLSHLSPGRTRLTLIPLADALQNRADQPAKARRLLGATHALSGVFHKERDRVDVVAYLTDTTSLVHLSEWQGDYSMGELRNMPVAIAGMVTGTLRLPPLTVSASVNAAAYADYSAGVALARRDPDVDRALPLLERAVQADPNSPLTHSKLAEAEWTKYLLTRDIQWQERALTSLKNAEERNPDAAAVLLLSGLIHESFGQYEQAQEDLLRAIELEPNNGDAWRRLGKVYEDNNQLNKALIAYRKAIEVQPNYFKNFEQLGYFFFRRGDYEEALQQRKRVVELVPDLADAHYQLAAPYLNMGHYADAEYELNLAISYQESANAVEGLGLVRTYQGLEREAIPYYQRAIKIGPATSLYYINLGSAWRRTSFPREAEQAYRKGLELSEAALAQNPKDGYERSCLAYLCAHLGDRGRAESESVQALQISGNAINVRWMIAQTYEVLRMRDRTLALLGDAPDSMLSRLNRQPDLADLQADPRFRQLLVAHHVQ
jgi:serine/threonine protein kinase/tetratricopeptide (TPR) repeat protein